MSPDRERQRTTAPSEFLTVGIGVAVPWQKEHGILD